MAELKSKAREIVTSVYNVINIANCKCLQQRIILSGIQKCKERTAAAYAISKSLGQKLRKERKALTEDNVLLFQHTQEIQNKMKASQVLNLMTRFVCGAEDSS
jgi:hypothetical protein